MCPGNLDVLYIIKINNGSSLNKMSAARLLEKIQKKRSEAQ